MFPTIPELQFEILLQLPYSNLISACQVNVALATLCQDDYFWQKKVQQDYALNQHKPNTINFRQQYHDLYQAEHVELPMARHFRIVEQFKRAKRAAREGRLDLLILYDRQGYPMNFHVANEAASKGQLKILTWLSLKRAYPSLVGANLAAAHGHLNVLEWLEPRILPNTYGASMAFSNQQEKVLNWLAEREIYP